MITAVEPARIILFGLDSRDWVACVQFQKYCWFWNISDKIGKETFWRITLKALVVFAQNNRVFMERLIELLQVIFKVVKIYILFKYEALNILFSRMN